MIRKNSDVTLLFAILVFTLHARAQSHSAILSWTPAQQPSGITIATWNVLRGTASGGPYTQIANVPVATTSYTDSTVSSGQTYFYVVQAVDTAGVDSADSMEAQAVIPTSPPPLVVSTTSLPPATAGTAYSVTITANGGVGPYTWLGTGVDGMTFSATGLLSGTPAQAGSFTQSVTVKDSTGATASASLSLSVSPAPVPLAVATSSLPPGTVGSNFSVTLAASGGAAPYMWSGTGVDGLAVSSTGVLSGIPAQPGSFTQTVVVTDSTGARATSSLTLTVDADPPPPNSITIDVQTSADMTVSSATSTSPAFTTAAPNELLLAFVATDSNGSTNATVNSVSGAGVTWALVLRANGRGGTSEIWRAFAASVLSNVTVTANLSQSVVSSITVMSFSGIDTSGTNGSAAIGATKGGGAIGAPIATLTTTRNNSWVIGVGNDYDNAIARTPGPNQTLVHQDLSPTNDTYWVQMQNAPTPLSGTSVSINDTAPTNDEYNLAIVELLPSQPTYSISGAISGAVASGVTVNLSGPSTASTTTDASGNYTFSGLSNGNYTVTPSASGFTFTPPSQAATIQNANSPGIDFTSATVITYSISGTVSGAVASGVTVNLTGTSTATTTTDASGNYTFTGLSSGAYTVTPFLSGFTFTPANLAENIKNASISGANFNSQGIVALSAPVMDAHASADSAQGPNITSPQFTTTSGNELLLAFISTDYLSGPNTTVISVNGAGLTWELVARTNAQSGTAEIWRAFAPTVLGNVSVTAALSQSVASSMTVVSFSGVDTSGTNGSGAIGATMSANSAAGAPTATVVTTRNNSWVFAVGNDYDNAIARTPGTTQTVLHQNFSPTNDTYWVQMQNSPTPLSGTSVTVNDTAPTGDQFNLTLCEILPAP